ncbi:MAG: MBL fold metallo-hydrolase [Planctomycetia bacterium]|nr:MBL fold metallo-hydrolase [Planctomycetia bacterium]
MDTKTITFCPLCSGSSGNSTFVACGRTRILVDCGTSGRHLEQCLHSIGIDIRTINHILITHAHTDHVQSAALLSRRFNIPLHASIGTWKEMNRRDKTKGVASKNIRIFKTGEVLLPIELGDLQAYFFPIPHDAPDPVGYRITNGEQSVAVATDLGHISPVLEQNLTGVSLLLLESNYDIPMLKNGPYPAELKKRILGDHGHLSNNNAGEFAVKLIKSGTKEIMFGHLSKENNRPDIAYQTVVNILQANAITPQKDAEVFMALRDTPSPVRKVS